MSITDKKGINITSGFKLVSGQPIDTRMVVDDENELVSLVDIGAAYEGQLVYVKSLNKYVSFDGSQFNELETGGGGSGGGTAQVFEDVATIPENPDDQKIYRVNDPQLYLYYESKLYTIDEAMDLLASIQGQDPNAVSVKIIPATTRPDNPVPVIKEDMETQSAVFTVYVIGNDIYGYAPINLDTGEMAWLQNNDLLDIFGFGMFYVGVVESLDTSTMEEGAVCLHYTYKYVNIVNGIEQVLNGGGGSSGGGSGSSEPKLIYSKTFDFPEGSEPQNGLLLEGFTPFEGMKVVIRTIETSDGGSGIIERHYNSFSYNTLIVDGTSLEGYTSVSDSQTFYADSALLGTLSTCVITGTDVGYFIQQRKYTADSYNTSSKPVQFGPTKTSDYELPTSTTIEIYEMPKGGGGGGVSSVFEDVIALPENPSEDVIYRLLKVEGVFNNYIQPTTVHIVETLPTIGDVCTNDGVNLTTMYYNKSDNNVYGYIDDMIGSAFGIPAGWYETGMLLGVAGLPYGGVVDSIDKANAEDTFYFVLMYKLYVFKSDWISLDPIGWLGSGYASTKFNFYSNVASGDYSHAEGWNTTASGGNSHAEGENTIASGESSHAEGENTIASGDESHAEGAQTKALGAYSHAEGYNTEASGGSSHSEGLLTIASGDYSHAEGWNTTASGGNSHAEGENTIASGESSHAEGENTIASGDESHAEGYNTEASGNYSHAEGRGEKNSTSFVISYNGSYHLYTSSYKYECGQVFFDGNKNYAKITSVSLETNGKYTYMFDPEIGLESGGTTILYRINGIASGDYSHAEGGFTTASGNYSHSEGVYTIASGTASHSEGGYTKALGTYSHAEGYNTIVYNNYSHAEGWDTTASNEASHAEGYNTKALGAYSHAEGESTTASGAHSHAEGISTIASGYESHAEGYNTEASGNYSHAEGFKTIASGDSQHVQGKFNIVSDNNSIYAHIVGNGKNISNRSNAHTLDWDGNAWFKGKVRVGGNSWDEGTELGAGGGSSFVDVFELPENPDPNTIYRVTTYGIYIMFQENNMSFSNFIEDLAYVGVSAKIIGVSTLPENPEESNLTNICVYVCNNEVGIYFSGTWYLNENFIALINQMGSTNYVYGGFIPLNYTNYEYNNMYIYTYVDYYIGNKKIKIDLTDNDLIYSAVGTIDTSGDVVFTGKANFNALREIKIIAYISYIGSDVFYNIIFTNICNFPSVHFDAYALYNVGYVCWLSQGNDDITISPHTNADFSTANNITLKIYGR